MQSMQPPILSTRSASGPNTYDMPMPCQNASAARARDAIDEFCREHQRVYDWPMGRTQPSLEKSCPMRARAGRQNPALKAPTSTHGPTDRIDQFSLVQMNRRPFTAELARAGLRQDDWNTFKANVNRLWQTDAPSASNWAAYLCACSIHGFIPVAGDLDVASELPDGQTQAKHIKAWLQRFNHSLAVKGVRAAFSITHTHSLGMQVEVVATPSIKAARTTR